MLLAGGGLGLFLLGMIVMTEGLRAAAGDALRARLMRYTRSPLTGAVTGLVGTTLMQSSSATTVAAIGFVAAELLSFPQALGIIFGANIGSTSTGWIVALLGLRGGLGQLVLPLILLGVLLRMFARGRLAGAGYALAGLGLIFVGLDYLQQGTAGAQTLFDFARLPADTWRGRVLLVLIGALFTAATRASSVGVAAALTALHTGAIEFQQAAALVIGFDIGTTVTALLATIGGNIAVRRTGFSHVIFNLLSAMLALLLIDAYRALLDAAVPGALTGHAELALVGFHTGFNVIGVLLILPFAAPYARFIERLFPEAPARYTGPLAAALLAEPSAALNAVQHALHQQFAALLQHLLGMLAPGRGLRCDLPELQRELDRTHRFVDQIAIGGNEGVAWERMVAMVHALDHLQRLHERCEEDVDRAQTAREADDLERQRQVLVEALAQCIAQAAANRWAEAAVQAGSASAAIAGAVSEYRRTVIEQVSADRLEVPAGTRRLEAIRWLERVSVHVARISHYLNQAAQASGK